MYAIHDFAHEIKNLVHALQNFGKLYFGGLVLKMSDIIDICQADKQCELSNNWIPTLSKKCESHQPCNFLVNEWLMLCSKVYRKVWSGLVNSEKQCTTLHCVS